MIQGGLGLPARENAYMHIESLKDTVKGITEEVTPIIISVPNSGARAIIRYYNLHHNLNISLA